MHDGLGLADSAGYIKEDSQWGELEASMPTSSAGPKAQKSPASFVLDPFLVI